MHFHITLKRIGVPRLLLREVLLHIGMYCGILIARDCFVIGRRGLQKAGVDLSQLEAVQS